MADITNKMVGSIIFEMLFKSDQIRQGIQPVQQLESQIGDTERATARFAKNGSNNMMQFSIAAAAMAATTVAAFKSITDQYLAFDRNMTIVKSVTGAADESFQMLSNTARELGATTEYGAAKAAEAMLVFARMGYDTKEIYDLLTPTVKLAASQQSDFADTARLVSSTIKAFKLETTDAERITNVFAATSSRTAANMDKLITSIQYVAPIMKVANKSVEEMNAALGMLFNAGMNASRAATSLRYGMGILADPIGRASEGLVRLGIDVERINPSMHTMNDILLELAKGLKRSKDPLKDFTAVFGRRASASMLQMAESVAKNKYAFEELLENVSNTTEATRQFEQQMNSASGQFLRIKSLSQEVAIGIGEELKGAFKAVGNVLEDTLTGFRMLDPSIKAVSGSILGSITAVSSLGAALVGIGWAIKTVKVGLAGLTLNPWIAGFTALAAGVMIAYTAFLKFRGEVERARKAEEENNKAAAEQLKVIKELEKKKSDILSERVGTVTPENRKRVGDLDAKILDAKYQLLKANEKLIDQDSLHAGKIELNAAAVNKFMHDEAMTTEGVTNKLRDLNNQLEAKNRLISTSSLKLGMLEAKKVKTEKDEGKEEASAGYDFLIKKEQEFNKKLREEAAELSTEILALKTKSNQDIAVETDEFNADELNKLGGHYSKYQSMLDNFLDSIAKKRAEFTKEIEKSGLTGYQKDAEEIKQREALNKLSLQHMLNDYIRSANKELEKENITAGERIAILNDITEAQKATDAAKLHSEEVTDEKHRELDEKYSADYIALMSNLNSEIGEIIAETNTIFFSSYKDREAALNASMKSELVTLEKNKRKELETLNRTDEEKKAIEEKYLQYRAAITAKYDAKRLKEQVDLAVNSINIINTVVSGAVGELMGLDQTATQVFSGIAAAITSIASGNVMGAIANFANVIASTILNARKEQERLEEERRKAADEAAKAVIDLRKQWRDFQKDVSYVNSSIEDMLDGIDDMSSDLEKKLIDKYGAGEVPNVEKIFDNSDKQFSLFLDGLVDARSEISKFKDSLLSARLITSNVRGTGRSASGAKADDAVTSAVDYIENAMIAAEKVFDEQIISFGRSLGLSGAELDNFVKMISDAMNDPELFSALKDHALKVEANNKVIDAMKGKTFDTVKEIDNFINTLKENSKAHYENKISVQSASDMVSAGSARLSQALKEAGDDPMLKAAAYKNWKDLLQYIKDDPALFEQFNFLGKIDLNEQVEEVGEDLKTGFKNLLDDLEDLFSQYASSIDKSLGIINTLFDEGAYSLDNYMAGLDQFMDTLSGDIPKDIADGIRLSIQDMKFDALNTSISELRQSTDELRSTYESLGKDLLSSINKKKEGQSRLAFLQDERLPEGYEYDPRQITRGFTPTMQIDMIRKETKAALAEITAKIVETKKNLIAYREEMTTWRDRWLADVAAMYDEMNQERTDAMEESQIEQNDILSERHRLLTDFAFAESQNERSNRMRKIRELDKNLQEEKTALEKTLNEIEAKRLESQERIGKAYVEEYGVLAENIKEAEQSIISLAEQGAEVMRKGTSEVGVILLETNREVNKLIGEQAELGKEILGTNALIIANNQQIVSNKSEEERLEGIINGLIETRHSLQIKVLMSEMAITNELSYQITLLKEKIRLQSLLSGAHTDTSIDDTDLNSLPTPVKVPRGDITLASGGITKRDMPAFLHKNEVVTPLDRLPEMMDKFAGKQSYGGRNVVVNFYDTIDMRNSISTMNNPGDVDRLYRNIILPAKKRNVERYRSTILEGIQ